jgi:hypothetical protein
MSFYIIIPIVRDICRPNESVIKIRSSTGHYCARHYRDYCFLTLKNNFLKQLLKLFEFMFFWMNIQFGL